MYDFSSMHNDDITIQTHPEGSYTNENEAVKYPTTYFETLTHIFRCTVGAGIFAMGDAFKNAGLLIGCIFTVFVGIISVHCQHILLTCAENLQQTNDDKEVLDYAKTVEMSFRTGPAWTKSWAKTAGGVINGCLCFMQLGFCAVYFVFISSNIQQIFASFDILIEVRIYMAIILIPIVLECLVRNLKFIAPLSAVANILMIVGLGIVFYYASQDLPSISERNLFGKLENFPLFFGTAIYAYVSIGLVIPLKNEMKKPEQFQKPLGVLNVGMSMVTVLLVTAGFLGYYKWGEDVQGSLTLNLPGNSVVTLALQGILAVAILLTLPIQFYVPVDIVWPALKAKFGPFKNEVVPELGLRIALVLLTFSMAEFIPHLSIFISFIGATCSTLVALIFPPILEIIYKTRSANGIGWVTLIKDIILLVIGLIGLVTGTYEAVKAIVREFST